MASIQVQIKPSQLRLKLQNNPGLIKDIEKRAANCLRRAQQVAPRDSGSLIASLKLQRQIRPGKGTSFQVVSTHPQIKAIIEGTQGGYGGPPPWGPGSALGGWGGRHGFATASSLFRLSRSIAIHGTKPAGTSTGKADWVKIAAREAVKNP